MMDAIDYSPLRSLVPARNRTPPPLLLQGPVTFGPDYVLRPTEGELDWFCRIMRLAGMEVTVLSDNCGDVIGMAWMDLNGCDQRVMVGDYRPVVRVDGSVLRDSGIGDA